MINGFGLEKLGLSAIRYPIAASLILLAITLAALFGVSRLGFSGENIEILRDGSQELADYDELLSEFRDFNNDAIILMQIENLATVGGIETFRDLNFEFQLEDSVESVLSVFSLVQYDPENGGWRSALPARFDSDEEVRTRLEQLAKDIPSAQSLFSPKFDSAVIVVYTKAEAIADDNVRDTMDSLVQLGKDFESKGIKITIAGQPAIRSDLIRNIVGDLVLLAPIALLMCAILAFVLFRSFIAMVLCAFPSLLSITWFLGGMGLAGINLNFLTNILPVLLIVIVFADTLHLYLKWQTISEEQGTSTISLEEAIRQIGPACAISSITTAAALISLCASGNNGLFELGIIGAIAIMAGFITIMVALPLGCYWAMQSGFKPKRSLANKLGNISKPAMKLLRYRTWVLVLGAIVCAVGLYAHYTIDSRFRLIDYLGTQSEVAQSEDFIDQTYYGTTPLFAIVQLDKDIALLDPENESRVYDTATAITNVFPADSFYSLTDFAEEIKKGGGTINEADLDELPRYLTSRFISEDKRKILITIFSSANLSASEMRKRVANLDASLAEAGLNELVTITGYPILSGVVAPRLMDNLRISLLIAVILSILIIAVASRSLKLGLACLVPNLLPIVCVELMLHMAGVPLNMSITVALTVAFGIAVDDSIHMLNQYLLNRQTQENHQAVADALQEVTPAIFSTTLILSAGMIIMVFSTLPAISVFSAVVIMTLVFAFLADILQLPAYLSILGLRSQTGNEQE